MKKILFAALVGLATATHAQIQISESFEGNVLPLGWTMTTTSATGTVSPRAASFGTSAGTACLGSKSVYASVYSTFPNNALTYSSTASNGTDLSVNFKYLVRSSTAKSIDGTMYVEYSTDGTTWTLLGNPIVLNVPASTTNVTIPCTPFSGVIPGSAVPVSSTVRVRVRTVMNPSSTTSDFNPGIDDFRLNQVATCNAPQSPSVSGVQFTQATLNWTAASTVPGVGYEYYVSTDPTSPAGTATPTGSTGPATTTVNLSDLVPETKYQVWVRSRCTETDFSSWIGPVTFTTTYCAPTASTLYRIGTLTTTGGTTNLNYTQTATGSGYRNLYSSLRLVAEAGATITQSMKNAGTSSSNNTYTQWVDWNRNGVFEDTEKLIPATAPVANGTTTTATYTIPATTPTADASNPYRARLVLNNSTVNVAGPCSGSLSNNISGEYLDFGIEVTSSILGTSETGTKDALAVYPNPFRDVVRLGNPQKVSGVVILDMNGRQIFRAGARVSELHLASLPAGSYLIRVSYTDGSVKNTKAIKR